MNTPTKGKPVSKRGKVKPIEKPLKGGNSTVKLPIGLHRFYITDHYSQGLFWFMLGLIYVKGMSAKEAATAFQEFLVLDNDHGPVAALTKKFYRQLPLFQDAIRTDRCAINLNEEELINKISNGIHKRIGREGVRARRTG